MSRRVRAMERVEIASSHLEVSAIPDSGPHRTGLWGYGVEGADCSQEDTLPKAGHACLPACLPACLTD